MIPPQPQATAVLADNTEVTLQAATVRLTEFTVGDSGRDRMPSTLPATSGYTYALEMSVDEARAMDATRVRFSQPLALYVDNFLNFPVGTTVPVGFCERSQAAWTPSESGRVIRVVGEQDQKVLFDLDGDGTADDATAAGITDDERAALRGVYSVGHELWRSPIEHFTPWDCNWGIAPPDDAGPPDDNAEPQSRE